MNEAKNEVGDAPAIIVSSRSDAYRISSLIMSFLKNVSPMFKMKPIQRL